MTTAGANEGRSGRGLRVTLVRGWAGKARRQQQTLRALGLRRCGDVNELPDNATVRGQVSKVSHLVSVDDVAG